MNGCTCCGLAPGMLAFLYFTTTARQQTDVPLFLPTSTPFQLQLAPPCLPARPTLIAFGSGCPIQGRCTNNQCGLRDSATGCPLYLDFLYSWYPLYRCACDPLCELYGDCCFGLQLQDCSLSLQLPSHAKVQYMPKKRTRFPFH